MTMQYEQINDTTYRIDGTLVAVRAGAFDGMTEKEITVELRNIIDKATEAASG